MLKRFWISIILTVPILLIMIGIHIPNIGNLATRLPFLQFVLATLVVFVCGWPILKYGLMSIIQRQASIFTLILLGTASAYIYSVYALVSPAFFPTEFYAGNGVINLYFGTASLITVLALLGQVLELKGKEKTDNVLVLQSYPRINKIVDKISSTFLPIIFIIVVTVFIVRLIFGPDPAVPFSLITAFHIMIISCPAAISLVAPMSMLIAINRGVKKKAVFENIRQNIFLASVYNAFCIPVAAGVLYLWTGILLTPMISVVVMILGAVSVIGNALRLR